MATRQAPLPGVPFAGFLVETGTGQRPFASGILAVETEGAVAVAAGSGAVRFAGFAPALGVGTAVAAGAGGIGFAGFAPAIAVDVAIAPGAGGIAFAGFAPAVAADVAIAPDAGSLVVTGYAPDLTEGEIAAPDAGLLVVTGYAPDLAIGIQTHVVVGGGARYIPPQPRPPLAGAGDSEQPPQAASGLAHAGAGVHAGQPIQATRGAATIAMAAGAHSLQRQQNRATAWPAIRGRAQPTQARAGATGAADVRMIATIRSGAPSILPPDYDVDPVTFEDDAFMSDLALEDA